MNTMKQPVPERLLRIDEVSHMVGLRKTAIYSGVKRKTFPAPMKLGVRIVAWPSSSIAAWIQERIAASGAPSNRPGPTKAESAAETF